MALLTRSREAPTKPASSSWVIGSRNSSASPASSSSRLAVRPVTSRNTESARAESVERSRRDSMATTSQSSCGRSSSTALIGGRARTAARTARGPGLGPSGAHRRRAACPRTGRRLPSGRSPTPGRPATGGRWRSVPSARRRARRRRPPREKMTSLRRQPIERASARIRRSGSASRAENSVGLAEQRHVVHGRPDDSGSRAKISHPRRPRSARSAADRPRRAVGLAEGHISPYPGGTARLYRPWEKHVV